MMYFLVLFCFVSVAINILLYWYNREAVKKIVFVSENISDMTDYLTEFKEHLNNINDMEVFYGDETIGGLLKHSGFLIDKIDDFEEFYSLVRGEGDVDDDRLTDDAEA